MFLPPSRASTQLMVDNKCSLEFSWLLMVNDPWLTAGHGSPPRPQRHPTTWLVRGACLGRGRTRPGRCPGVDPGRLSSRHGAGRSRTWWSTGGELTCQPAGHMEKITYIVHIGESWCFDGERWWFLMINDWLMMFYDWLMMIFDDLWCSLMVYGCLMMICDAWRCLLLVYDADGKWCLNHGMFNDCKPTTTSNRPLLR